MQPVPHQPTWPDALIQSHADLTRFTGRLEFHMPGWEVLWRVSPIPPAGLTSLRLFEPHGESVLTLVCATVNTYRYQQGDERLPHKRIKVQHSFRVPLPMKASGLPGWFRHSVHLALMHEADEWIRVDDWMQWNPHGAPVHEPVRRMTPLEPYYRLGIDDRI